MRRRAVRAQYLASRHFPDAVKHGGGLAGLREPHALAPVPRSTVLCTRSCGGSGCDSGPRTMADCPGEDSLAQWLDVFSLAQVVRSIEDGGLTRRSYIFFLATQQSCAPQRFCSQLQHPQELSSAACCRWRLFSLSALRYFSRSGDPAHFPSSCWACLRVPLWWRVRRRGRQPCDAGISWRFFPG